MYNVKFLKGTNAQFNAEGFVKDINTFYYIDETDLYLGSIKLSNGADLAAAIVRIAENESDIVNLQKDIAALTGGETGSISGMINDAVDAAKTELEGKITEVSTALATEKSRAEGVEAGLRTDLNAISADYLTSADKTELEGKITAEETRAKGIEGGLDSRLASVEEDIEYFFKDALGDTDTQAYKDTLKEIQDYIDSDASAAATMAADIKANADAIDAIEADYLKEADKTELTTAINGKADNSTVTELSGKVTTLEGQVATKAEQSALNEVSGKVSSLETKLGSVSDVAGSIATAKQEAITAATNAAATDATTKANTAEQNAKDYADSLAGNYDVKGAANTAEQNAKNYADGKDAETLQSAKDYADGLAKNYDAAGSANTAAAGALEDAKEYADDKILALDADVKSAEVESGKGVQVQVVEVDGLITTVNVLGNYNNSYDAKGAAATAKSEAISAAATDATSKANTAEANAKTYVDTALTWGTIA